MKGKILVLELSSVFFYNNQAKNGNTVNFQHLLQYFGTTDAPDLDHCKFWCDPTGEENLEFATALNKTCEEKQQAILGRCLGHIGTRLAPVARMVTMIRVKTGGQ